MSLAASLQCQIKYGESYFRGASDQAIAYRGEIRHLNYCLNYPIPVVLIVVQPTAEVAYWVLLEPRPNQEGRRWMGDRRPKGSAAERGIGDRN